MLLRVKSADFMIDLNGSAHPQEPKELLQSRKPPFRADFVVKVGLEPGMAASRLF